MKKQIMFGYFIGNGYGKILYINYNEKIVQIIIFQLRKLKIKQLFNTKYSLFTYFDKIFNIIEQQFSNDIINIENLNIANNMTVYHTWKNYKRSNFKYLIKILYDGYNYYTSDNIII